MILGLYTRKRVQVASRIAIITVEPTFQRCSFQRARKRGVRVNIRSGRAVFNSPFPSCCMPQFQSESWCTTIQKKLSILMQIKLISLTIVEHQDPLRNRDKQQLGNGPLSRYVQCKYYNQKAISEFMSTSSSRRV